MNDNFTEIYLAPVSKFSMNFAKGHSQAEFQNERAEPTKDLHTCT
jgi:hypothetical protein